MAATSLERAVTRTFFRQQTPKQRGRADYLKVLKFHWSGKDDLCLSTIADLLSVDPRHPQRCLLYRLWIELLADQQDFSSLGLLEQHLRELCLAGLDDDERSLFALRGICMFESDEWHGAQLFSRAFEGDSASQVSSYGLELIQKVKNRLGDPYHPDLSLCKALAANQDFCHWKLTIATLAAAEANSLVEKTLEKLHETFPGETYSSFFHFHQAFACEAWADAMSISQNVTEEYPENVDFWFYGGVAAHRHRRYASAARALEMAIHLNGENEPEATRLLSDCYQHLATKYNYIAGLLTKQYGLPSMQTQTSDKISVPIEEQPPSCWFYNIPERDYSAILEKQSWEKILQISLPDNLQKGDLCFFGRLHPSGECKLLAAYQVVAGMSWDPVEGNLTQLVNLADIPHPIVFHPNQMGEKQAKNLLLKLDTATQEQLLKILRAINDGRDEDIEGSDAG